jgi:PKD repeat protein
MRIDLLPPPTVEFYYSPSDPSTFDDISFNQGGYWDPSVTTLDWDFGDGTTAAGASASHKFAADGDYTVTLTGTTADGRSNSQTQTVQVRTPTSRSFRSSPPAKGRSERQT